MSQPETRRSISTGVGAAAGESLRRLLAIVQSSGQACRELRIDLPAEEGVRMRNLVHRGTQRPVFKITSVKMDRVVQCESILEFEAVLLLDVCSRIRAFAEQPVRIHYQLGDVWSSHIPDFVYVLGDTPTFLEIKFSKDVDAAVLARTRWLEVALARIGARYMLLTEVQLRRDCAVQNALRILRRARHAACEVRVLETLERLRGTGQMPLAAFGWNAHESIAAVCIAQLIVRGLARVSHADLLTDATLVHLANEVEEGTWLPAASV